MECILKNQTLVVPEGTVRIGFRDICEIVHGNPVEEILLPQTLEVIEDGTFFDFTEIETINIPANVKEIGSRAFWGLDRVKELFLPGTVEQVKKHAFCNLKGRLVIACDPQNLPTGWDAEFAANVKKVCFTAQSNFKSLKYR